MWTFLFSFPAVASKVDTTHEIAAIRVTAGSKVGHLYRTSRPGEEGGARGHASETMGTVFNMLFNYEVWQCCVFLFGSDFHKFFLPAKGVGGASSSG